MSLRIKWYKTSYKIPKSFDMRSGMDRLGHNEFRKTNTSSIELEPSNET